MFIKARVRTARNYVAPARHYSKKQTKRERWDTKQAAFVYLDGMYQLVLPHPRLSPFIHSYWQLDLSAEGACDVYENLFAYPYVNLVFSLGTPYFKSEDYFNRSEAILNTKLIGLRTLPIQYRHTASNYLIGVKFQPGGLYPFSSVPAHELVNQLVSLVDVLPTEGQALERLLSMPTTLVARSTKLNAFFGSQIKKINRHPYTTVQHLLGEFTKALRSKPATVDKWAESVHHTSKTIERYFNSVIGLPPKRCLNLIRCRQAVCYVQQSGDYGAATAFGYYDQNHFIKEVKKYTGLTPSQLIVAQPPVQPVELINNGEHTSHNKFAGSLLT